MLPQYLSGKARTVPGDLNGPSEEVRRQEVPPAWVEVRKGRAPSVCGEPMERVLLLTGRPGTGKTVLIREAMARTQAAFAGFYTEEIRASGARRGFRMVTLDGETAILAHVGISGPHRVGRYGVDTASLERVGVSALVRAAVEADLIVIDEIGKMELISPRFRDAVMQAIDSGKKVLGTIMLQPHPFSDEIKRHPAVEVLLVTRNNRARMRNKISEWLTQPLG